MKNWKIFILETAFLISFSGLLPNAFAQDALNDLSDQHSNHSSTQFSNQDPYTANAQSINEDKIKATMTPGEFHTFQGAHAYVEQNSRYTLGPDDVIDVVVMRHPEVSGEYIINKEGKIQYEFVGDVIVAGHTKDEVAKILTKKLSLYIIKPQVTIKIAAYNSKIVYVVGEVARPGKIPMRGDTITVRDALLEAGLPLITAANDSASIFTPSAGHVSRRKVNVDALLYKGDLRQNFILHPGDCLYVPPTFLAKAMRAISPVTEPIANVGGAAGAAKYAF